MIRKLLELLGWLGNRFRPKPANTTIVNFYAGGDVIVVQQKNVVTPEKSEGHNNVSL